MSKTLKNDQIQAIVLNSSHILVNNSCTIELLACVMEMGIDGANVGESKGNWAVYHVLIFTNSNDKIIFY